MFIKKIFNKTVIKLSCLTIQKLSVESEILTAIERHSERKSSGASHKWSDTFRGSGVDHTAINHEFTELALNYMSVVVTRARNGYFLSAQIMAKSWLSS